MLGLVVSLLRFYEELTMDNLTFRNSVLLLEGMKVTPQSSYPVFILLLLAYVFTMISNIGLIVLISTEKNLHNPMHFLFCNLPLNDILGTTVILPRLTLMCCWGRFRPLRGAVEC